MEGSVSVFCLPLYLSSRASESKGVAEAGHIVINSKQLPDSLVLNYRCLWVLRTDQVQKDGGEYHSAGRRPEDKS